MLLRTHLVIAVFLILLFLEHIQNKILFVIMILVATIIPDLHRKALDSDNHPLKFFSEHKGVIHSFTIALVISLIISFFWPKASLGFFLGYSIHLLCDSFTKEGVQAFWPIKVECKCPIKSGGRVEQVLFLTMILVDFLLFLSLFMF